MKAVEFYSMACKGYVYVGCYNLGLMYAKGQEVKQDALKAEALYVKACQGFNAYGCANLGLENAAKFSKDNSAENVSNFRYVCYDKKSVSKRKK